MSLIIKGVDMPKKNGESMTYSSKEIIEIPRPHGRLIDADALEKKLQHLVMSKEPYQRGMAKAFLAIISCEPTIIEAEVRE